MDDLCLLHSCSCSSSISSLRFCRRSSKVCDSIFVFKDQQNGIVARSNRELSSLRLTFHPHRNILWRALPADRLSPPSFQAEEGHFVKDEEDLNIFERLSLAWRVIFPKKKKPSTPAEIAKQRLKMILISDRCAVNDNAKRQIVSNIVGALANFVEIESQERVRLNVSADPDLGMVYSVSVPVRRVKPEYQDNGDDVNDDLLREGDLDPLIEEPIDFPAKGSGQLEMSITTSQEGDANRCSNGVQDVMA